MGAIAGLLATFLSRHLNHHGEQHALGVPTSEVLFRLAPEGPARRPDVAFVTYDRWPYRTLPEGDPPALDVIPNLAVEVISPTNTAIEVIDKIRDYFFAGVDLVWVIYPQQRLAY